MYTSSPISLVIKCVYYVYQLSDVKTIESLFAWLPCVLKAMTSQITISCMSTNRFIWNWNVPGCCSYRHIFDMVVLCGYCIVDVVSSLPHERHGSHMWNLCDYLIGNNRGISYYLNTRGQYMSMTYQYWVYSDASYSFLWVSFGTDNVMYCWMLFCVTDRYINYQIHTIYG